MSQAYFGCDRELKIQNGYLSTSLALQRNPTSNGQFCSNPDCRVTFLHIIVAPQLQLKLPRSITQHIPTNAQSSLYYQGLQPALNGSYSRFPVLPLRLRLVSICCYTTDTSQSMKTAQSTQITISNRILNSIQLLLDLLSTLSSQPPIQIGAPLFPAAAV